MFNVIKNGCQFYYDNIPVNTVPTICKSAIYAFSVNLILVNSLFRPYNAVTGQPHALELARPVLSAAVCSLASLIHALITPIFHVAFGDNQVTLPREFMKNLITLGCTYQLTTSIAAFKTYWAALSIFELGSLNFIGTWFKFATTAFTQHLIPPLFPMQNVIDQCLDYVGLLPRSGDNSVYFMPA